MQYSFLDSGKQQKLERFGKYLIARPCSQAIWEPRLPFEKWSKADGCFTREKENKWTIPDSLPKSWIVEIEHIRFKIAPTDFGHLGVFPEHAMLWKEITDTIKKQSMQPNILNLFAYSGGATLTAAKAGARVCHLDSSKGMVAWARENAALNGLTEAPIRWIVEDVVKFLRREIKRGTRYDGIILDPPSFGRGSQGEVFKIERDLKLILELCRDLFSARPLFLILSSHTPGFTPIVMRHILSQMMQGLKGKVEAGEMLLSGQDALDLPCGSYARWTHET
jgi:23S rRNA (cytosine1962-C5)-methyltransferase